MQQFNASNTNILNLGGVNEAKSNIMSVASQMHTGELVEVVGVDASGLNPVGYVSVKPLTLRNNADDNTVELGVIHNVPYFRIQGGKNAVIIDPEIGDIGFCGFSSRDTSLVKRNRTYAGQNVYRVSDLSDAFYFGGWSKHTPEQYVQFTETQVIIKAKEKIILDAPEVVASGKITASGIIESLTDVIAKAISLFSHKHGNVQSGNSDTSTPK